MTTEKPEERGSGEAGLPPEVESFRREVIGGSLMRFDVLSFFYKNPYAILTISDLSTWMSREEKPLADALQKLASLGYLAQSYASAAYVLTDDQERRLRLEDFFGYLEDHPEVARKIRARLRQGTEAQ